LERLVFEPNGRLVFDATVTRSNRNLFIFAKEVVSEDQQAIGSIGWADLPPMDPLPSATGQPASTWVDRSPSPAARAGPGRLACTVKPALMHRRLPW
jgi:hypothetical protein